jgi:uncharacterized protein YndB with AHSA1/START domain
MPDLPPGGPGPDAHGMRIVRVFEASREAVWAEWTTPEAFADWFGGEASEVPVDSVSMDVRPGGGWRATMFAGPARQEMHWAGRFLELEEPARLVLTITDEPEEEAYELVTVELADLGDGRTEMTFEQRGHMTPDQYGRAQSGWGTFFARMSERLRASKGA